VSEGPAVSHALSYLEAASVPSLEAVHPFERVGSSTGCLAIARALRRHEMPTEEILAILETEDPGVVHRYIELHRERLEERLAEQLRALEDVERLLTS
jgi:hypothetical protein